jgi:hypothetical protein
MEIFFFDSFSFNSTVESFKHWFWIKKSTFTKLNSDFTGFKYKLYIYYIE